jgi:signal peptidase I
VLIREGKLYINDELSDYYDGAELIVTPGLASEEVILEENEYFVIGDNYNNSEDSRSETVGIINKKDILGKVWFILKSSEGSGFIKEEN